MGLICISGLKLKRFKTTDIAVLIKICFEFTRFFKLQNVLKWNSKNKIHFNTNLREA